MPKAEEPGRQSRVWSCLADCGFGILFFLYFVFFFFFCLFLFCFLHVRAALLGVIKITRLQRGCRRGEEGHRRETNVYAANTFHVNTVRSWSCLPAGRGMGGWRKLLNSFLVLLSWGRGFLHDEVTTTTTTNVANLGIVSFLVAVSPSCLWLATPTAYCARLLAWQSASIFWVTISMRKCAKIQQATRGVMRIWRAGR